jgi:GAF domain-containing protein
MLLQPMIKRLQMQPDLESALNAAVADAVALHGAEFGNIQLCCADGTLVIVAHSGLPQSFLKSVGHVKLDDGSAWGRAVQEGRTILMQDVAKDLEFRPFLPLARNAGFRSILSSPLISTQGSRVGVLSVHFAMPHAPSPIEISTMEAYCKSAADYFAGKIEKIDLTKTAEQLHKGLLQ